MKLDRLSFEMDLKRQKLTAVRRAISQTRARDYDQTIKEGCEGALRALKRVQAKKKNAAKKEATLLKELVQKQSSAIKATNLERLLKPGWSERASAFKLLSKVPAGSKEDIRVQQLLEN
jgi:hypothetical protein